MKKSILSLALAVLMVMTLFTVGAFADGDTLTVGVGENYTTISDAVKAAKDGDTIYIKDGTYQETVTITGKALTLEGESRDGVIIKFDYSSRNTTAKYNGTECYPIVSSDSALTIKNLTIAGPTAQHHGIGGVYASADLTMDSVTVKDIRCTADGGEVCGVQYGKGIMVDGSGNVSITNCEISSFQKAAIDVNTIGTVFIDNNIIKGVGSQAIIAQNGIVARNGDVTISNNEISDLSYTAENQWKYGSVGIYPCDNVTKLTITDNSIDAVDNLLDVSTVNEDVASAAIISGNTETNLTTPVMIKETGTRYATIKDAVDAAQSGETIVLLDDVTLDGSKTSNNQGVLDITGKNIVIDGGSHTLTIAEGSNKNAHAVNIQANSNVTIKNITIDGANITKNGINVYQSTAIIGENVTVKNNPQHGVVVNGSDVTVDGLTTEGNGQGGINVDNKAGDAKLIVEDAEINETFSIKYEKTGASGDVVSEIKAGSFKIIWGPSSLKDNITVSGGTFTSSVAKYVSNELNYELNNDGIYTYYPTLEEALDAAKPGAVIKDVDAPAGAETYTVVIDPANGGEKIELSFSEGMVIDLPDAPKNSGYIFLGWRCDNVTYKAGETVTVNSDMTYTAVWGNLPDVDPEDPEEPEVPDFPFYDVNIRDWYYDAVYYVWDKGLMDGVDTHEFAPNATLTRAMVWTIIARAEGVDTTGGSSWYAKAQEWVVAKGISDGENPSAAITRQELVTMLYRLAGEPTVSGSVTAPDAASVSAWASDAMVWAMNIGLIEGDENGAVTPTATATRAQAAAIFMRYIEA